MYILLLYAHLLSPKVWLIIQDLLRNFLFLECTPSLHIISRMLTLHWSKKVTKQVLLKDKLNNVPFISSFHKANHFFMKSGHAVKNVFIQKIPEHITLPTCQKVKTKIKNKNVTGAMTPLALNNNQPSFPWPPNCACIACVKVECALPQMIRLTSFHFLFVCLFVYFFIGSVTFDIFTVIN